MITNRD